MRAFSKGDMAERDELTAELRVLAIEVEQAHADVVDAVEAFNGKLDAYNAKAADARDFVEGLRGQIEDYMGGRSDKWREGEKGEAYQSWQQALDDVALDDVEPIEWADLPDLGHADTLDNVQSEVEEP